MHSLNSFYRVGTWYVSNGFVNVLRFAQLNITLSDRLNRIRLLFNNWLKGPSTEDSPFEYLSVSS